MTQDQALAIMKSGANVFLTGEPGAGKTHTVNRYVDYLRQHGIEPALTASTGIAATHISGMTVHSWSGIGIAAELSPYDLDRISGNERIYKRLSKAKVLIVDEISMLDARTLGMVDQVCRAVRRNHLAFGGLQTVFVGDFFQLPPVAREGRGAQFAFRSSAWAKLQPTVCYLSEQYRQDDPAYLSVLTAIRSNDVRQEHVGALESRAASRAGAGQDVVKLFSHNIDVDRINDRELAKLEAKERSFSMSAKGPAHLIDTLKRSCLSPEALRLKPGAAVMFTRNNQPAGFVNGTLGTVVGFDHDTGFPKVRTRHGSVITAEPMDWKIEDQGQALAAVQQVPLRLAWAMTIHKSQGMSLDAAVMDLGSAFEYGQGYVALSRVRRLSGLFLLGCNRRALEVHPEILEEDRELRLMSQAAESEFGTMAGDERDDIERRFIEACGGRIAAEAEKKKSFSVEDVRKSHPKAYSRWSPEEEQKLVAMFKDGRAVKEIARQLDRKRGGITARLKKLGLIES
ncbi:AAA family ATPase [Candidatus Uhrbacteria bacterium]|nr:AAA family ATPase [Candidatus Uhrbacteria bacterium]